MLYPLSYEGGGWRIPGRKLGAAVEIERVAAADRFERRC
jgi:hypothetical protein